MNNSLIKILYVDDDVINLKLFQIVFKKKYEVIIAENATKALEILEKETNLTIVISDFIMPNINGIEFIKIAKNKFPIVNFSLLTGIQLNDEIQEALTNGLIQNYLSKPFKIEEIENFINQTLK